ncbi:MAG TPA: FIST C-terminal domain-containing protein, partial [Kofleriaceae bacterium]|nr:FIST C-terminal domain-containing protein [Kofleriaceae bacterium]
LRITKVDSTAKRALEIDGKPAAKRYAELLGVGVDDLEFGKPKGFAVRPTALRVGREYFIRAPWKPLEDGSILFANMLEENSELELVRLADIVDSTRRFFEIDLPSRVSSPRAVLLFHCSGRKWFAESTGKASELSSAFHAAPPCAGMNVHFEIYCGFHINTTLTALAFGASA